MIPFDIWVWIELLNGAARSRVTEEELAITGRANTPLTVILRSRRRRRIPAVRSKCNCGDSSLRSE